MNFKHLAQDLVVLFESVA